MKTVPDTVFIWQSSFLKSRLFQVKSALLTHQIRNDKAEKVKKLAKISCILPMLMDKNGVGDRFYLLSSFLLPQWA